MESTLVTPYPHFETLVRLVLALAVGLFVGLEREWRGKEAGLRTFGFAALLGALGGRMGDSYALLSIGLLGILVVFLNWQTLRANQGVELTTSAALLVTGFAGVLCGLGHSFTPVAVAVGSAALLAWKERLAGFSLGLAPAELRSAILLALLAFVVYPALPVVAVDPWGLVQPRSAWLTVILIAAIGFANYVLLKLYGTRGGELASFLGGLVNSTVTVRELAQRVREAERDDLIQLAYRGVLLATAAMIVRNLVLLGILSASVLPAAIVPMGLMLLGSAVLVILPFLRRRAAEPDGLQVRLTSPFSLQSALKFGLIFLALQVGGTLAQEWAGHLGFYAVSAIGGLFSSSSAVASAAELVVHGRLTPEAASTGAVIATVTSAAVNLPVMARVSGSRGGLLPRLTSAMLLVAGLGVAAVFGQELLLPQLGIDLRAVVP